MNDIRLGEDMYEAMKKNAEMPEVFDDDSENDSLVMKTMRELIIKMTSHHASDRPSAEDVVSVLRKLHVKVKPAQPAGDVDPALRLLQALNDKSLTHFPKTASKLSPRDRLRHKLTVKKCKPLLTRASQIQT